MVKHVTGVREAVEFTLRASLVSAPVGSLPSHHYGDGDRPPPSLRAGTGMASRRAGDPPEDVPGVTRDGSPSGVSRPGYAMVCRIAVTAMRAAVPVIRP